MTEQAVTWSVFAKPWADLSGTQLGQLLSEIGFNGVEIPIRDTSFVTPERAENRLPAFVADLADFGVVPISVAGDLTEEMFAACAAAGVPMIRVMAPIEQDGYGPSVDRFRMRLEQCAPWAERYGVQVGVQPHHGPYISSAHAVLELIDDLPAAEFRLVWDAAHDALAGDDATFTLEAGRDRLGIVNLKNALYRRLDAGPGDEGVRTRWRSWFVAGDQGLADWASALGHLAGQDYTGPICLSAQYSEVEDLRRAVSADLALARQLFAR